MLEFQGVTIDGEAVELVVSDCDDGINGDIADWADATLRK